jgi:hypothetical protein
MNRIGVAAFLVVLVATYAIAQDNLCANPKTPRLGILVGTPRTDMTRAGRSSQDFEGRFADALAKVKLFQPFCVVRDAKPFADPANYPTMKGSVLIKISSEPSTKNSAIAAIAVEIEIVEGPTVWDGMSLATVAVLIESPTDFDKGAEKVSFFYSDLIPKLSIK